MADTKVATTILTEGKKPRAPQGIRRISIEKLHKRLLNVMSRDVTFLMEQSFVGPLTDKQASTVINYLKLSKELKRAEDIELNELTDEELELKDKKFKRKVSVEQV